MSNSLTPHHQRPPERSVSKACHRNSTETTYICLPRLSDYSGECNNTGIFLFCQDLSIGKISCLQTVLNLMEADKQVRLFFIKIIQLK